MTATSLRHSALVTLTLATLTLALFAGTARAQLEFPAVISDQMVLQRNSDAPLWGFASPGEEIVVQASWNPMEISARADDQGRFELSLATPDAGGPHSIKVRAGSVERVFEDVLIGEVWVCTGQSNMEWALRNSTGGTEAIAAADHPTIRLFDVAHNNTLAPQSKGTGKWRPCTPDTAQGFSAVAYFFARELQQELGVPIGLLGCNWGGTRCEAWTPEFGLRELGSFDDVLDRMKEERDNADTVEERHQKAMAEWRALSEQADEGIAGHYMLPSTDTSGWKTMELPVPWENTELGNYDGVTWFHRTVDVHRDMAGTECLLELGPVDDFDTAWINGQKVGETLGAGQWQTPRKYRVPVGVLKPGDNTIAVRVRDSGGGGGFVGTAEQMRLASVVHEHAVASLAGDWRYRATLPEGKVPPMPVKTSFHRNSATVLFNGMLAPVIPFSIRGAIWYQGESNRNESEQYRTLFPKMIESWRRLWKRGDFPFYFVQLAPFTYGEKDVCAKLREAQLIAYRNTPNTGMAVIMDVGNPKDIHPRDKQTVGHRLALWALAKIHGKDIVFSGPLYKSMTVEGSSIRVAFDFAAEGLVGEGGELTHFTIAGADQIFHPAVARVDGHSVVVSSEKVAHPVAVRYAFDNDSEPNLFNSAGLPASSFRTDQWNGVGASQ